MLSLSFLCFGVDRCRGFLGEVADRCGHRVGEAALQDIRFRNGVRRGGADGLAGADLFECALCQSDAFDLSQRDGLCFRIDVRRRDIECDGLAQFVLLTALICVGLGNDQRGIDRIVGIFRIFRIGSVGDFSVPYLVVKL